MGHLLLPSRIFIFMTLLSLSFSSSSLAQSFDKGFKLYKQGRYQQARSVLRKSVGRTNDPYEKAMNYKILGLTEYKLRNKRAAVSSFKRALRLDPSLKISSSESKDRKARSLFARVKKKMGGSSARSARRGRSRAMSSSGGQLSLPMLFLPAGINQFMQDKPILGSIFAAGQAGGLILYFVRNAAAEQADEEATSVYNEQQAAGVYSDEEYIAYLEANDKFVKAARAEANYGLYMTIGFYAGSVVKAYLDNSPSPSRRRRAALDKAVDQLVDGEVLEDFYLSSEKNDTNSKWQLALLPHERGIQPGISWNLSL